MNSLHAHPLQPEQAEEEFLTVYQAFLQYIRMIFSLIVFLFLFYENYQVHLESCYVFSDNTHFSGCAGMVNLHFNYPLFYSKTDKK